MNARLRSHEVTPPQAVLAATLAGEAAEAKVLSASGRFAASDEERKFLCLLSDQRLRGAFGERGDWRKRYAAFIGSPQQEGPPERAFGVAGAGFEPATSGL